MTKFINIPAILLIALISLSFSCGQQDSSSPVTQETNQNELDLSDFGEPYSAPGTARTYPDIFTLFDTSLEEFATPEEGKEFCTDPANLGSIFRYPNPESEQTFEYESCVGVHLESKTENSRPSTASPKKKHRYILHNLLHQSAAPTTNYSQSPQKWQLFESGKRHLDLCEGRIGA